MDMWYGAREAYGNWCYKWIGRPESRKRMAPRPSLDRVDFGGVGPSSVQSTEWWYLIYDLMSIDTKSRTWWSAAPWGLYWWYIFIFFWRKEWKQKWQKKKKMRMDGLYFGAEVMREKLAKGSMNGNGKYKMEDWKRKRMEARVFHVVWHSAYVHRM